MRTPIVIMACIVLTATTAAWAQGNQPADGASQEITMEIVRQDMVDLGLAELLQQLRYLSADLASNGAAGSEREKTVAELVGRLEMLRQRHLAEARSLLQRGLSGPRNEQDLRAARAQIEAVSRELGSVLLRAGITYAMEVFTNELGDLAREQEEILAASIAAADAGGLFDRQRQLADRVDRLLGESETVAYDGTQALAAVRLSQARKQLRAAGVGKLLRDSAAAMQGASPAQAAPMQKQAIQVLRQTEGRLWPEAQLQDLARGRNELGALLKRQQQLHRLVEAASAQDFAARQTLFQTQQDNMRRSLLTLNPTLGVEAMAAAADEAFLNASKALAGGDRPAALSAQTAAEDALQAAIAAVQERISKLQQVSDAYLKLKAASDRLRALMTMEDRQMRLRDAAAELAGKNEEVDHLAPGQNRLSQDVETFIGRIPKESNWSSMMPDPLRLAAASMLKSAESLGKNLPHPAQASQEEALTSLRDAADLAEKELSYLEQIWTLKRVAGDLRQFASLAEDIGQEQQDIVEATERASAGGRTVLDLTGKQQVLAKALNEMREMVATIDQAKPLDDRLVQALAAAETAAAHLGKDNASAALAAQAQVARELQAAGESATALVALMEHAIAQLSSVEELLADIIDLLKLQIRLRKQTEIARTEEFPRLAGEQEVLQGDTETFAEWFERVQKSKHFRVAYNEMGQAIVHLNATNRDQAVQHQKLAEDALRLAIKELHELIESLMKTIAEGEYDELKLKYDPSAFDKLVVLIMKQRGLRNATEAGEPKAFGDYASRQDALKVGADEVVALLGNSESGACVVEAGKEMQSASDRLRKGDRDPAVRHQQLAEKHMRKALTLQLLAMIEAMMALPDDITPDPTRPVEPALPMMGPILLVAKQAISDQQEVKASQSDFDPLAKRDREALNEHFARELPIEFRGMLKNYFDALSK